MNPPTHVVAAIAVSLAAGLMVWPRAKAVVGAPYREFPGPAAECLSIGLVWASWAFVFACSVWIVLHVPRTWHKVARISSMITVTFCLSTFGSLTLLPLFVVFTSVCTTTKACTSSPLTGAVYSAFSQQVLPSPYPELLWATLLVFGVGVALRNRGARDPFLAAMRRSV